MEFSHEKSIILEIEAVLKTDNPASLSTLEDAARQLLEDELTGQTFCTDDLDEEPHEIEFCDCWVEPPDRAAAFVKACGECKDADELWDFVFNHIDTV